jgi:hypothetical protein
MAIMTIVSFRAQQVSRKSRAAPAVSTAIAVVAALTVGLAAAVIGNNTHHDWQAKIIRFTTQPAKAAPSQTKPVTPAGRDTGT